MGPNRIVKMKILPLPLREGVGGRGPRHRAPPPPNPLPQGEGEETTDGRHETRPADRLGRHRRLQGARTDPSAARQRMRRHLRADRGGRAVRHAAVAPGAERRPRLHRPVLPDRRERDGAHPALAQRRPRRGGACLGGHPGEDGRGPRGRSCLDAAAGHRQAGAGGARDERADVAACGDRGEHGPAGRAWHSRRGAGRGRDGLQRIRPGPARRTAGDPRRDRGAARPGAAARRTPRADHQRTDARADRSGALHRQPLQRAAGPCDRGGARRTRARA